MILGYDASRSGDKFVRVSFPAANAGQKQIEYQLDVVDIYPESGERPSTPTPATTATAGISSPCDIPWLKRNYSVIESWADKMIDFDLDNDGLMEYPISGNSGSWPEKFTMRPSNWWDTIGFCPQGRLLKCPRLQGVSGHGRTRAPGQRACRCRSL
jgi:hypothetical protein